MGWNSGGGAAGAGSAVGTRVTHSTTSPYNSGVWTSHAFDTETVDDSGWHSTVTNNSRITVDVAGWHSITACWEHVGSTLGSLRGQRIIKNGASVLRSTLIARLSTADPQPLEVSCLAYLAAGDYIELQGFQNTGASPVGANAAGMSSLEVVRLP